MSDGRTWSTYSTELPAIEGTIVKKLNISNDGSISENGVEVSKIYGTNGATDAVAYVATSVISGSVSGITYAPSGLNALYRIQGLDWTDYISYESSTRVNADSANPYGTATSLALDIVESNDNINNVEISYKEVGGQLTDVLSVKFYVTEKKPIEELSHKEIIPSSLDGLPTDVVVGAISGSPVGTTLNTATSGDLLTGNMVGSTEQGTLGIIMVRKDNGKLVATTCAHVINSEMAGDGTDNYVDSPNKSTIVNNYAWRHNPLSLVRGTVDDIAILKTSVDYHTTDLATLTINDKDKATPFVRTGDISGGSYLFNGPVPWALPNEVIVGMKLFRKGIYGTDIDSDSGNFYHAATVTAINSTISISFVGLGTQYPYFKGVIRAQGRIEGGDSGCPVYANINGRIKYVGNIFASAPSGTETTGSLCILPCWQHAGETGIPVKPWNGDLILTKRTTPTLNMYGRVYEFIGYTTLPATHTDAIIDP